MHSSDSLKQGDWTPEEERILVDKHAEIGAKVGCTGATGYAVRRPYVTTTVLGPSLSLPVCLSASARQSRLDELANTPHKVSRNTIPKRAIGYALSVMSPPLLPGPFFPLPRGLPVCVVSPAPVSSPV